MKSTVVDESLSSMKLQFCSRENQLLQSKTKLKSYKSSGHHDKVIPVSDYTIPQTMSEHDSISRTIGRNDMQDMRREIPAYADPIYRPPPKPTEIQLCMDSLTQN